MASEKARADFPDEKQRLAVAYETWKRRNRKAPVALLRNQQALLGRAYKLYDGVEALDGPTGAGAKLSLNKGAMTATAVFASENVRDRQGDITRVAGIQTDGHRLNPVVLWDHGLKYSLPIGCNRDGTGAYTVVIDDVLGEAVQTTHFSQTDPVAGQVYHLIAEGIVNANSFGYRTIQARRLPPDPANGLPAGKDILTCDLLETTWTAVQANPEAVGSLLGKGLIGGKRIAPCIKSLLLPQAPRRRAWSNGAALPTNQHAAPAAARVKGMKTKDEMAATMSATDETTGAALRKSEDEGEVGAGEGEETEINDNPDEMDADVEGKKAAQDPDGAMTPEPPSATTLRDLHADLGKFHTEYSGAAKLIEHPEILKYLSEFLEDLGGHMARVPEVFKAHHAGLPGLGQEAGVQTELDPEEKEEEVEGDVRDFGSQTVKRGQPSRKSFTKAEQSDLDEIKDYMEELQGREGLTRADKHALKHLHGRLKEMCSRGRKEDVVANAVESPAERAATGVPSTSDAQVNAAAEVGDKRGMKAVAAAPTDAPAFALTPEDRAEIARVHRQLERAKQMLVVG